LHRSRSFLFALLLLLAGGVCARVPLKPQAHQVKIPENVKDDRGPPGIQLAARQQLLEYGTQQGMEILKARVQSLHVPNAKKAFNLPLVGKFVLELSNLRILTFSVPSEAARTSIENGGFEFRVTEVEAQLGFDWHWEKLGMQGSGQGELDLLGGDINYRFRALAQPESGQPHIIVDAADSSFNEVELVIHSYSADWLYQAVLSLFNGQIRKAVQSGIQSALQKDVPDGVNKVLSTLPTHLEIKGLPFNVGFEYSLFTLTYVLLQGYGEIASEARSKPAQPADHPALVHMQQCPFDVTPLPLSPQQVGAESHMLSIYLHHSVANCMLWGLYNAGSLQIVVQDGTVPKLHLTTDLLAMLIPELPKKFPHQQLRIEVAATKEPLINFSSDKGIELQAVYQTEIYVQNATLHDPLITRLLANVTIEADMSWESTIITAVNAKHTVQEAIMAVPAPQWDMTVAWFIQNYAGLYPLRQLVTSFVHTPVSSMLDLTDTESQTYEGWYSLAAEVEVTGLPTQ